MRQCGTAAAHSQGRSTGVCLGLTPAAPAGAGPTLVGLTFAAPSLTPAAVSRAALLAARSIARNGGGALRITADCTLDTHGAANGFQRIDGGN